MDFGQTIERAARIVWKHKLLAALGILDIILTGSGLFARALVDLLMQYLFYSPQLHDQLAPLAGILPAPLVSIGQLGELYRAVSPYGAAVWAGLIGGVVIVVIGLAVLGIVIEAGVIAAVGEADPAKPVSLRGVFASGWRRALPMVVIASVPAIPLTVGAILVVIAGTAMTQIAGGLDALVSNPDVALQVVWVVSLVALLILFPLALLSPPLDLFSVLAYRACMLDGLSAAASFRKAWRLLRTRADSVLLLIGVGFVVSVLAGAVTYLPRQLELIFLPAIVIVWLVRGIARTYYLALWTVGWRSWTAGEGTSPENSDQ